MANYEWIEKDGITMLYMHVAGKNLEDVKSKIAEFRAVIDSQPKGSLLTISDVTDGYISKEVSRALAAFSKDNNPYIKMSVLVGVTGLKLIMYNSVIKLAGRDNIVLKNTKEEAIDFLCSQKKTSFFSRWWGKRSS